MKLPIIIYTFSMILIFSFYPCLSQSDIYLQHRHKQNRHKKIDINRRYTIQTSDSIYYKRRLAVYSKDTLTIYCELANLSTKIPFDEVIYLEKAKKSHVFEALATIGAISLSVSPIIWATEGNEAALEMLQVSGVFLVSSVPFLVLSEIRRKKDTKNKWIIISI